MANLAILDISFNFRTHALPDILPPCKLKCPRYAMMSSGGSVVDRCNDMGGCGFVIVVE